MGNHDPYRIAQIARAVRRHGVDADQEICCRHCGGELVEQNLRICRIDGAGIFRGPLRAGCAPLKIDRIDLGDRKSGARSPIDSDRSAHDPL
jgi:hypothetical protein